MIDEIYLTLVGSVASSPSNTLSHFITRLPETLQLKKDHHQVGLVDILYPRSMPNLPDGASVNVNYKNGTSHQVRIPRGHYERADEIVDMLNDAGRRKERVRNNIKPPEWKTQFFYDKFTQLVGVKRGRDDVFSVDFGTDFSHFLGFTKKAIYSDEIAKHRVDYFNQKHIMYIYSDLVFPSIIGDTRSNLLQCCPISGDYGTMVRQNFNPVRYHDVMTEEVSTIEIKILSEQAEPIDFSFGSVLLTLHIKNKH